MSDTSDPFAGQSSFPVPPIPPAPPGRSRPPWEQEGSAFERFVATARGVLLEPDAFFSNMRLAGGIGAPLLYGIIGSLIGGLVAVGYQVLWSMTGMRFGMAEDAQQQLLFTGVWLVVMPVVLVLALFISAAIYHVMLLLVGGGRSFEVTMRVVSYANGSVSLLNVVPICGGLIAFVWGLWALIVGMARAHDISTGKAAAVVLVPMVACCLLGVFIAVLIFMAGFGAAMAG
jgi:hypothetical protein